MVKKKTKIKVIKPKKKLGLPIAVYVGDVEIFIPEFKKIVNKGDAVLEMPLKEARARTDFIVKYESED